MVQWLAIAAAMPLAAAAPNHALAKRLIHLPLAVPARPHQARFNLPTDLTASAAPARSIGMMVHDNLAPNAMIGLGFAKLLRRARPGPDFRISRHQPQSRKPGFTFVYKF